MIRKLAIAVLAAAAASAFSGAPVRAAPVSLTPQYADLSFEDQTSALWLQLSKTATLLNYAITKAQGQEATRLGREELKAMIMLRLRLNELSGRLKLNREDLANVLADLDLAQKIAAKERIAAPFNDFSQQADQTKSLLSAILDRMETINESSIRKYDV